MASIEGPDLALIHSISPRKSVLSRKVAGQATEEQVLAANVEFAFIVTSFNDDFNPRRIERYLALIKGAGVAPVILLNKSDLADQNDDRLEKASLVANDAPVYRVSAVTGEGLENILSHLKNGKTGIFLGSSGVGKSTILNQLLGKEIQATQTIRLSDSKGRHTTTARQMFILPNGGLVIDTPGLREIQLWGDSSALIEVYADIARFAEQCRFRDCRHRGEVDCAVARALETGELAPGRWMGYTKLQKELSYLKRKQDPEQSANSKRRWKSIHKKMRDYIKRKRG
ncbi:MAG: ribosome small subunit-dependent GTPase A [Elusimicrobia bacterium]|nr:ribosome small subunit-dependent GTPase A [Candidatus Obscuribacterium magneticum]